MVQRSWSNTIATGTLPMITSGPSANSASPATGTITPVSTASTASARKARRGCRLNSTNHAKA